MGVDMVVRIATVLLLLAASAAASRALAQSPPYWGGHARDAQHTALSDVEAQPLARIRWHVRVDLRPQNKGDLSASLLTHYGSPLLTQANTVVVPVKTGARGRFRVEGRRASDGSLLWRQPTDYRLPPYNWVPSMSPVITATGKLWIPGAGGSVYVRSNYDARGAEPRRRLVFFGEAEFRAQPSVYKTRVFINTPLTADAEGNVYFGFMVTDATPLGLESGIARISNDGVGTWISAAAAAGDAAIRKVQHNSAPALSRDGKTLYVAVTSIEAPGPAGYGYLLALDSTTLATVAAERLHDPTSGLDAGVQDDSTSSPTVGPDGDVYFGTMENPFGMNHYRGRLLHFDAALTPKPYAGLFGWDDTVSIVPSTMVPSYAGSSAYLLMSKYNNYLGGGGDGINRVAVLDPGDSQVDPITGAAIMREVMTVAGPTPDATWPSSGAVREWCINTAAVDPIGRAVFVNNEDGILYRWDMATGTLSQSIVLTPGLGEAYTPTVIGPDGTVYAINNATLFAVGL